MASAAINHFQRWMTLATTVDNLMDEMDNMDREYVQFHQSMTNDDIAGNETIEPRTVTDMVNLVTYVRDFATFMTSGRRDVVTRMRRPA